MQQNLQVSEGNVLLGLFSQMTPQNLSQGFESLQGTGENSNFESLLHEKIGQYDVGSEGGSDINQSLESFPAALNMVVTIPSQTLPPGSAQFFGDSTSQIISNSNGQAINTENVVLSVGGKTFPQEQQMLQMEVEKVVVTANSHPESQVSVAATKMPEQLNATQQLQISPAVAQQLTSGAPPKSQLDLNPVRERGVDTRIQIDSGINQSLLKSGAINAVSDQSVVNENVVQNKSRLPQTQDLLASQASQEENNSAREIQTQRPRVNQLPNQTQAQNSFASNAATTVLKAIDAQPVTTSISIPLQQDLTPSLSRVNQDSGQNGTTAKVPPSNSPAQQNPMLHQTMTNQIGVEAGGVIKTVSDLSNEVSSIIEQQGVKSSSEKMPNLGTLTGRRVQPEFVAQVTGKDSDVPEFLKFDAGRETSEGQLPKTDLMNQAKESAVSQMNTIKPAVQPAANNFSVEVAESSMNRESLSESSSVKPASERLQNLPLSVAVNQRGWGDAFSSRVQWLASNNVNTAEIRLDPAHLGKIEVQIDLSGPEARVMFNAEHAQAREALENAMPRLREMMSESGFQQLNVDIGGQERKGEERHATGDSQTGNPEQAEQALSAAVGDETEQTLVTAQRNMLGVGGDDGSVDFYA